MAACWAAHYTTNQPTPPPFCPCHIRPPLPAQPHQCLLPPPSSSSSLPLRTVAPPCIWKGYEISVGGSWVQGHSNTMYTELVLPLLPTPSVLLPPLLLILNGSVTSLPLLMSVCPSIGLSLFLKRAAGYTSMIFFGPLASLFRQSYHPNQIKILYRFFLHFYHT